MHQVCFVKKEDSKHCVVLLWASATGIEVRPLGRGMRAVAGGAGWRLAGLVVRVGLAGVLPDSQTNVADAFVVTGPVLFHVLIPPIAK